MPDPEPTLASLASTHAGAPRVLQRHGLDFCCGGEATLEDAARLAGLDARAILDEIAAADRELPPAEPWSERTVAEVVDLVIARFHEPLRAELPRLVELARTVESVHASSSALPPGLPAHLVELQEGIELHMQKEEEVLFPLLRAGRGAMALVPIQVMEEEHRDHGESLRRTRALTGDFRVPPEACSAWRALYVGLEELERALMEHIHVENWVLFPAPPRIPPPDASMAFHVHVPDDGYYREQILCQSACPVGTDARGYVRAIAAGDFERAYLIARGPNPLASICGRVCGAPCEAACRRGALDAPVSIRALKRTATERFGSESGRFRPLELLERALGWHAAEHEDEGEEELRSLAAYLRLPGATAGPPAKRVAIVGSGPAGLACAHDLALLGHRVTVFEMEPEPAGMLLYGIPEYRLPRDLIRGEVEVMRALGVEFRCGTKVGADVGFAELLADFDSVVVAVGVKNSRQLRLPGIDGPGVGGGVEFLRDVSLGRPASDLGRRVVVVGGGNVAYDVARTAIRQVGIDVSRTALRQPDVAAVTLVSLESLEEMPADDVEILEGDEEGVKRLNSLGPVRIERDGSGRVTSVLFQRCRRVFDEGGRFAPEFDAEDTTRVPCDTVLMAIGQTLDLSFIDPARDGVELSERGTLVCDSESGTTSRPGLFVAGDAAYGPKLLIHAVASGKKVARSIHRHLTGVEVAPETVGLHRALEGYEREADYEKIARAKLPCASVAERLASQSSQVERALDEEAARREAARCFDCGVNPVFDGGRCVLCGGCVEVCPESCLKIVSLERVEGGSTLARLRRAVFGDDDGQVSAILKDEELCIRCALCAERCPNDAITMERFCFKAVTT